jgi:hypothetical protein
MAFLYQQSVPPVDPNTFTGPTRTMSGIVRMLTPTLDAQYGEVMRWIYVGVSGNVSIITLNGTTQVLVGLVSGIFHPIWSLQVNSSGTTATSIVVGS